MNHFKKPGLYEQELDPPSSLFLSISSVRCVCQSISFIRLCIHAKEQKELTHSPAWLCVHAHPSVFQEVCPLFFIHLSACLPFSLSCVLLLLREFLLYICQRAWDYTCTFHT